MIQEGEGGLPAAEEFARPEKQVSLLPALICAGISVFLMNSGLFSFFFLVPLGYAAIVYNSAWLTFLLTAIIHSGFSLAMRFYNQYGAGGLWMDIFYLVALSLCFAWIMQRSYPRIRTAYRFVLASAAGSLSFLLFVMGSRNDSGFAALIRAQAEALSSLIVSSTGADAVKRSFLQQMLTPENIMEAIKSIALRGGALVSVFFLFYVNRQMALLAARIIKKKRQDEGLSAFFAPNNTIWVFSSALALVLLTKLFKMEIPEILAWNVLVVCGILFLAQGAGIAMFFMARRPPAFRLIANVLVILVIFSPGLNTVAIAAVVLLGIAENWLPLRAPKQNGEASTPGL